MDEKRITAALDAVERLKSETGLSQEKAGSLIGVKGSILSTLKSGTYKGDVERQIKIIEDYFSVKGKTEETYKEVDYADTSISHRAYEMIKLAHIKGGLAVFAGDAGIGKTKAAKKYVKDTPTNSYYCVLNPCLTSLKSILKLVADMVGARPERSLYDMWSSIRSRLSDGSVIIFDEAQHLTYRSIEALRAFADSFAEDGQTLGIVFIGNTETVQRFGGRQKAEFAQIANRTKQRLVYTTNNIRREDISLLFPILADRGMNAEIDFLLGIARTQQALRGAVNLFSNAYDNDDFTLNGLVKMAKFMEMDLTGLDLKKIRGAA